MALRNDWSMAGSWTSKLYDILRPARHPRMSNFANSCSRSRHSPGSVWRTAFSSSVYHDLAGTELQHTSSCPMTWRRFVRVENLGLSGVVFYEISIPPVVDIASSYFYTMERADYRITMEKVFGDLTDPSDLGMDLDDLLDAVDAKVVYFPAYACTSFIVGQVMSAFLNDQPTSRPFPAHQGFSVCLEKPNVSANTSTATDLPFSEERTDHHLESSDLQSNLAPSRSFRRSLIEALSLEPNNPYISLCIRSSTLYNSASCDKIPDAQENDKEKRDSMSTVDSIGLLKTPSTSLQSCSQTVTKTAQALHLQLAQGDKKVLGGRWLCIKKITKEEGIKALYKGLSASCPGVTEATIQWVLYEKSKSLNEAVEGQGAVAQWAGMLGSAGTAKLVVNLITYPREVLRTRLRQPSVNGVLQYTGLVQTLRLVIAEEGARTLYSGLSAHLMRVVPDATVMYPIYKGLIKWSNSRS
ncbi:mitochondrial carrier domain-containing protein [Flammula alnicola]|nr:mitochondrial carrier domain-containing protein [Flammula alnicola]